MGIAVALGQRLVGNLHPHHGSHTAHYVNGRQSYGLGTFGWSDRLIQRVLIGQFERCTINA